MRRSRQARLALASALAALTFHAAGARAEEKAPPIWEDPAGLSPVPIPHLSTGRATDVAVVGEDDRVCGPPGTQATVNAGQTFVPRTDRIWRMDFATSNAYNGNVDPRPGIVRIYKWQPGGYLATLASRPLFVQHIALSYVKDRLSLYPDLRFGPDERDDVYLIEFSIPGKELTPPRPSRHPYVLDSVRSKTDPYPDGSLLGRSCIVREGPQAEGGIPYWWDLWFQFYGARPSQPSPPPLHPSDPGDRWYEPLKATSGDLRERYWRRVNDYAATVRPSALERSSQGALVHVLRETMLYLACKHDDRCPSFLDEGDLLANIQRLFQRAVEERANCRQPEYGRCYIDFIHLYSPGLAYLLLREDGALDRFSPELRAAIRDLIFKRTLERSFPMRTPGTNNWALSGMATCAMFHSLFPEDTPPEWIDYYRTIWKGFWDVRENETESDGYQQLSLYYILFFSRFAPSTPGALRWYVDIWSDPHFRKLIDRYQQTVTPIGTYPNFGDGSGISLAVPALIWLFEEAGARYRDASYRETARRLLDYNERHARGRGDSFEMGAPTIDGLSMAYLAAGSAKVPEQPADPGSVYTLRRRAARLGDPPPPAPPYTFSASGRPLADIPPSLIATAPGAQNAYYVPDKLILRSGAGPDGLAFVFNLLNGYSHGHPEIGTLSSFTDDGSILMMDTPFASYLYRRHQEDESGPVMRHFRGGLADFSKRGIDVEMSRFTDARHATVAWTSFHDLHGWQVGQERHFLFAKDRFLLVRDGFQAGLTRPGGIEVAIGPIWHAADVHPEHDLRPDASDWYDVYFREPYGNGTRFRNPERHALLYLVGRSGYQTAGYKEGGYLALADATGSLAIHPACRDPKDPLAGVRSANPDCRTTPPFVIYQRWMGTLEKGESRWFDSLLLPHSESSPAAAAARIHELDVGADYTALQIDVEKEKWIVVDNPSRRDVSASRLSGELATEQPHLTNAEFLLLRIKPGDPPYLLVSRADYLHTGVHDKAFIPAATGEFEGDSALGRDGGAAGH
jgi:hypothetical protein